MLPSVDNTPMNKTDFYNWIQIFGNASGEFNGKEYQIYNCRPLAVYQYLNSLGFIKGQHAISEDSLSALKYIFDYSFDVNHKQRVLDQLKDSQ